MDVLTVRQALELPIFSSTRLVAGSSGLDNIIQWVHVVDITNAHYQWQREGVLLLTSGLGLYREPETQRSLVSKLIKLKFAGLVLSTGYYFDHIPEAIREDAERLGLPIIEAPPDLLFIQIAETILSRTVDQRYALLQQSAEINQRLTTLVLEGASLTELADQLSKQLHRSVTIESPTFQLLASAQSGSIDRVWQESLAIGRSTPEMMDYLISTRIYSQLVETAEPQYVKSVPELGMEMDRMVAPIVVNQVIYGYIWLSAGDQPLMPLDRLTLDHGVTVAALILVKEQAVRTVEDTLQGDLFTQLLIENSEISDQLKDQSERLNYHRNRAHQVLVIKYANASVTPIQALKELIRPLINRSYLSYLLFVREDHLVAVLETEDATGAKVLADQILTALTHPNSSLVIGIGTVDAISQTAAERLRKSYTQAQEAAHISILLGEVGAIAFDELGILHWLYHLSPELRENNLYLQHVRTIAAHDKKRSTALLETLETYLQQGCSVADTAKALYVHRNTLLNRIKSLESVCNLSLKDAVHFSNFDAAIKCYRLHG
ncbi:MAG: PucR family transcriptional regulator ligand-binding domain-containing protein [Cyanobacteria bacterium P01_D01_bin.1]